MSKYPTPADYTKPIRVCFDKTLGYEYFIDREHPLKSGKSGKVYYHRHVASVSIGRWVERWEHVHHEDDDRSNNAPDNLVVTTQREHARMHAAKRRKPQVIRGCAHCGAATASRVFCSVDCCHMSQRVAKRPPLDQVEAEVRRDGWRRTAAKYGVTDNAVRKWFKTAGRSVKNISPHRTVPSAHR